MKKKKIATQSILKEEKKLEIYHKCKKCGEPYVYDNQCGEEKKEELRH